MLLMLMVTSTSLERLFDYLPGREVPSEAPREDTATLEASQVALPSAWPARGALRFSEVTMRYRPGLAPSLAGVSFEVGAGERCGVVGRTGAGKSSLLVALFRLVEVEAGLIEVDGVAVAKLGLRRLRRAMAMIPQEAVLMPGTVRDNLDPFNEISDGRGRLFVYLSTARKKL